MSLKNFIVRRKTIFAIRILLEMTKKAVFCIKTMANRKRKDDPEKMMCDLTIRTHAIEKGMSIGDVKIGFGKTKALSLINDLQRFVSIKGNKKFVEYCCQVLFQYIQFNVRLGADMEEVEHALNKFIVLNGINLKAEGGGIINLQHSQIREGALGDFALFSKSRYSVRDFDDVALNYENVYRSIKMCEKTPSACNRQPWRLHVYTDKALRETLFRLQRGCNGFYQKMQCAILICADMRLYGFPEMSLPFVDGGMYAMNLLYALNYNDLAAIPLTLGHKHSAIEAIKTEFCLQSYEMPILLIGVGSYKKYFKVAESERHPFTDYTFKNA